MSLNLISALRSHQYQFILKVENLILQLFRLITKYVLGQTTVNLEIFCKIVMFRYACNFPILTILTWQFNKNFCVCFKSSKKLQFVHLTGIAQVWLQNLSMPQLVEVHSYGSKEH